MHKHPFQLYCPELPATLLLLHLSTFICCSSSSSDMHPIDFLLLKHLKPHCCCTALLNLTQFMSNNAPAPSSRHIGSCLSLEYTEQITVLQQWLHVAFAVPQLIVFLAIEITVKSLSHLLGVWLLTIAGIGRCGESQCYISSSGVSALPGFTKGGLRMNSVMLCHVPRTHGSKVDDAHAHVCPASVSSTHALICSTMYWT